MKVDAIVFLVTLPIMLGIVIIGFRNWVPNLINFCARELVWLFP